MTNRNQYNWDAKDWRDITPQCDIRPIQPTPLQIAEDALLECQRLLKAADDYEWLYWNTDYPQRVDKHIAEALDAVSDLKTQAKCAGGVTLRE